MTAIALIGQSTAGGGLLQNNPGGIHAKFKGKEIAVDTCRVADHPPYGPAHPPHADNVSVVTGTGKVKIKGYRVVLDGDSTSCGHPVVAGTSGISST